MAVESRIAKLEKQFTEREPYNPGVPIVTLPPKEAQYFIDRRLPLPILGGMSISDVLETDKTNDL